MASTRGSFPAMRRIATLLAVALALALPASPARAQELSRVARLRLATSTDHPLPGSTIHLAVVFDLAEQWHVYWRNPGASGTPTEVVVTAPEGFVVGAPIYPRPRAIPTPEGVVYGYERQVAVLVPVTLPARLPEGPVPFKAEVSYLVCKESCLLGQQTLEATLPGSVDSALVEKYLRRAPRPMKTFRATARLEPGAFVVEGVLPPGASERLQFFPDPSPGVTFGRPEIDVAGGRFVLRVPIEVRSANALGRPMACRGLVGFGHRGEDPCFEFTIPVKEPDS